MKRSYTLEQANKALVLLQAIAKEWVERRQQRRELVRSRAKLENCPTPEGMRAELAELDAQIWEHDEAQRNCLRELQDLGMTVLTRTPLTVHIPGTSKSGAVVFCWQEGETSVCHGHPVGSELEQRRPLRVRNGS